MCDTTYIVFMLIATLIVIVAGCWAVHHAANKPWNEMDEDATDR